jgi:hypothetical protein
MEPKYAKRQKVRIVSAKDQHFKPKHPQLEEHVSESGVIIDYHWFGIDEPYRMARKPKPQIFDHCIYTIHLDKDGSLIKGVPEDALESIEQERKAR